MIFEKSLTDKNTRKEPTILTIDSFLFSQTKRQHKNYFNPALSISAKVTFKKIEHHQLLIDSVYILTQFWVFVKTYKA